MASCTQLYTPEKSSTSGHNLYPCQTFAGLITVSYNINKLSESAPYTFDSAKYKRNMRKVLLLQKF